MRVCLVGNGNLSHALVAVIGQDNEVNVLTSTPFESKSITAFNGTETVVGRISKVSSDASEVIPECDVIIFTVPSFARREYLNKIKNYVKNESYVGSFPGTGGFNEDAKELLKNDAVKIFSAQRVPCIARIIEKNRSVKMTLKESMLVASDKNTDIKDVLEKLLKIRVDVTYDFMEVNLSNSNPILHSARLFEMFNSYNKKYNSIQMFYEDWNDESSAILLKMDEEFMTVADSLNLRNIKSLKEHYGVKTVEETTKKIRSIEAFKGILVPMIRADNEFSADYSSRYFTEDVEVGLKFIVDTARELRIGIPTIDTVYESLKSLIKN